MANADNAFGFVPVSNVAGAPNSGRITKYFIPSTNGAALYVGDLVTPAGSADTLGIHPTVTVATAGGGAYILGAIVGFEPVGGRTTPDLNTTYCPTSTASYVYVADDPDQEFIVREDSVDGALAATDMMLNADWIAGTGSTSFGTSGAKLDSSTAATTNTLQFRILGLYDTPDNVLGANAILRVKINLHSLRYTTGV